MQVLLGLIFLCAVILLGTTYLILHRYVSRYPENKVCDNIYIGPVNVSGMTEKEVVEALEKHLEKDRDVQVTMKVGKKEADTTLEELGIDYKNIKKTAARAVTYGNKGSLWVRYRKIRKLSKEKLVLSEDITLDQEKAAAVIKKKAVPFAEHAVDAAIEKTTGGFDIQKEKEGKTVDTKKSIAKLIKYLNGDWKHKDFSMKMTQKKEHPSVKSEDLAKIKDELGTFATDAGGGERWKNLKTGVDKINGTVLMPGEEASVHDLTAPYDAEHGYAAAGSYENGQVVETYGGGICQVSTTLYNALLFSEVEIVKRYPHSMVVAYIDPSRDAAIAGDTKDLKFKNNYDDPIYIAGEIDDQNRLTFTIYGKDTREKGRSVEFESETISTEEYGTTYKEDSEAPIGSMESSGSPHTGKEARLWKIVYKDGKEVSRDVINNSSYNKSDRIVKVGTASSNAEASALVRNAIATQSTEKINTAISRAGSME